MARWSSPQNNWTPAVVADTTAFAASGYQALQGGSTTQRTNLLELFLGGLAAVSSAMQMILARDSTVGVTPTPAMFNPLDAASAALAAPPVGFKTASTQPQRSATAYLLTPAFNGFGGVVRWVAAPGQEIGMLGNTAPNGELSLSCSGGTPSAISSHFIVEPF